MVVDAGDDLIADREAGLADLDLKITERPSLRITSRASAFSRPTSTFRLATMTASSPSAKERHQSRDHLLAARLRIGRDDHALGGAVDLDRLGAASLADAPRALAIESMFMADHRVEHDRLGAERRSR